MFVAPALILVLPVSLMFALSGCSKLRHERLFTFKLLNLGLRRLASRSVVRALGLIELFASAAGLSVSRYRGLAISPMTLLLLSFTAVLLARRPDKCGCGSLEANWQLASIRNLTLIGL